MTKKERTMSIVRLQGEAEKQKHIYFEVDASKPAIGEGGMGKVMRGVCVDTDTNVTRPVAIKFLYDDLPAHAIERARREASIQLRNDNLVEMIGFVETESYHGNTLQKHYHVVSELLTGVSLSDLLEGKCNDVHGKEIPFVKKMLKDYQTDPVHFAKIIVINVLSGLMALHDAGYIHRDIDPSNIMLTEDGHIKLIDFGICKQVNKLTTHDRGLTTTGVFMGKAEYAAPELVLGDLRSQNQTTDIYAIGILLYQCIVGHVPFEGPSHQVLNKQLHKKMPLSTIKDKKLRKIIEIATEKNQSVRYQTAAQMRVAIENIDGKKKAMKLSTKLSIVGVAVVVVVAILAFFLCQQHKEQVLAEQQLQKQEAINDSLIGKAAEFYKLANEQYLVGEKHDEGYEKALIDAYKDYSEAIKTTLKVKGRSVQTLQFVKGRDKAKQALQVAKDEFETKAKSFEEAGMGDVAQEFLKRADGINRLFK